ncbi:hypothetical protein KJ782_04125 [Patescibacteria group bacterium]|nr:hypothetical protein [Patescibacteria group bacterium]
MPFHKLSTGRVDGWTLKGLKYKLVVQGTSDGGRSGPFTVNKDITLYVREVVDPIPHWQIYRWIESEPEPIQ